MTLDKTLDASQALDILYPFMENQRGKPYQGFTPTDPFKALIGTLMGLRTRGSTAGRVEDHLFQIVSGPADILAMSRETLVGVLRPLGHSERREHFIRETCRMLMDDFAGKVPDNMDDLLKLPGVGRKTANLTLDAGFGRQTITVDTHVHRIMNIWGYVETKNANETENVLRSKLTKKYWKTFNPMLVDFGNLICWPTSPKCSQCPLSAKCPKIGVTRHR